MRRLRRILLQSLFALAALAAVTYVADELWARYRGKPVEKIKVDRVYTDTNHWNEVEYSVGTSVMETCVDALMPHFGYVPCWYLRKHTLQQLGNP